MYFLFRNAGTEIWSMPHLALVHLDFFIGMCLPCQLLQLLCCVLTCLQMGLYDILSNTVYKKRFCISVTYVIWWSY